MTINAIRVAIRDAALNTDGIGTAYEFRPTAFNTSPLVYVDVPSYERVAFGKGAGRKRLTVTFDVVLIVASTWDQAKQKTLDDLMVPLHDALEADQTLSGTVGSSLVKSVRGLRARQNLADDADGAPQGAMGAVYELQVEATL